MIKRSLNKVRDRVFNRIHSNYLIYNTCWEDPRIDRQLLNIQAGDKIVMITSAGCNALDYLQDNPGEVHCIDMNPRQNAVLALKQALFKHGSYADLEGFFLKGRYAKAFELYRKTLRPNLPPYATAFWDKKIGYFWDDNPKRTYYYHGTSGLFAWYFCKYIRQRKKLYKCILDLFNARSLEEQKVCFDRLEPILITKFATWMMNRHVTMSLLGVPRSQRVMVQKEYPGGMAGFLAQNMRNAFTLVPVQENYFWNVYLHGHYTPECCPTYLKADQFDFYRSNVDKITLYTTTLSKFLQENPGKYNQFILLDHQDWLASYSPDLLAEEWKLILDNSAPGARIILRSAKIANDFVPAFVHERAVFQPELTRKLHPYDRVGTYASVHLAVVK
jgi:S-adenosylmethionine-diacylglycerol 3-amino-3-carboxypropyl transferase